MFPQFVEQRRRNGLLGQMVYRDIAVNAAIDDAIFKMPVRPIYLLESHSSETSSRSASENAAPGSANIENDRICSFVERESFFAGKKLSFQ
jgi:hypothetical protein